MSVSVHGSTQAAFAAHPSSELTRRHRHPEAQRPEDDGGSEGRRPQLRHALTDAISDALADLMMPGQTPAAGSDAAPKEAADDRRERAEALHHFKHELFAALRPAEGEGPGRHGRGFGWGRTSLADLADRIDALAQKIGGSPAAPDTLPADTATAPEATTSTADSTPPETQPALAAPSASADGDATSALLSAFKTLTEQSGGSSTDGAPAESLAALLQRIAQALRGDEAAAAPAAGSLLDITA